MNQPADTNPTNDKAVLIVTDLKTGKRVRILCYPAAHSPHNLQHTAGIQP